MPDPRFSAPTTAAIALGSNLPSKFGSPADNLRAAIDRMNALGQVSRVSSFYRTAPVGFLDQPDFLNAALLLETTLSPEALITGLLAIETAMGRTRPSPPWKGPRIIDLDLLLCGLVVLHTPRLTVPHPAMAERFFVLGPLAEIAPAMLHPVLNKTIAELLRQSSRLF